MNSYASSGKPNGQRSDRFGQSGNLNADNGLLIAAQEKSRLGISKSLCLPAKANMRCVCVTLLQRGKPLPKSP
jgi:hypothetical protein